MLPSLPDPAVESVLARLGVVCRQTRIGQNRTQAEQAELAEISLRAAQNIESGQSGQTAILFKYLVSLELLDLLYNALPNPEAVSPLEQLAMEKHKPKKPQRASRNRKVVASGPKWGDESPPAKGKR